MKRNRTWFTLVEMVTVIVILAILMTVGTFYYRDYTMTARNGLRAKDMSNMSIVLEAFKWKSGFYPPPSSGTVFTFMGSALWTQWTFGDDVYANVSDLDRKPLDPSTNFEYTYSLLYSQKEFQLATAMEDDGTDRFSTYVPIDKAYAAVWDTKWTAYVMWTYNWQVAKINIAWTNYILALPSIIASDSSSTDVTTLVSSQKLVYHGFDNLPYLYSGSRFNNAWGFPFTPVSFIALSYAWTNADLQTYLTTDPGKLALFNAIKTSYTGTNIATLPINKEVIDIDAVGNPTLATETGQKIAENRLKFYIGNAVDPTTPPTIVLWSCQIETAVLPCTL